MRVMPSSCLSPVALLAACGLAQEETQKPTPIPQVIANIDALDGHTVTVAGYLGECMGYECSLYIDRQDYDETRRWLADLRARNRLPQFPQPPSLGIGSDNNFDRKAAGFINSYVLITGEVMNDCRWKGERGCTDRSPDIKPTAIASWRGPVEPASTKN